MSEGYVIGTFGTRFGRFPDKSYRDLGRETVRGVLADAGQVDERRVGKVYFGSTLMHVVGQTMIRGQACLLPLMEERVLEERLPIVNVEGACATGSLAFHQALEKAWQGIPVQGLAKGKKPRTLVGFFRSWIDQSSKASFASAAKVVFASVEEPVAGDVPLLNRVAHPPADMPPLGLARAAAMERTRRPI